MPTYLNPQWMLLYGLLLSAFVQKHPAILKQSKKWSKKLLQLSIILLGSKLKISEVIDFGLSGLGITFISLSLVFLFGHILRRPFSLDRVQSLLITVGTGICGGSAIAATSPLLKASGSQITISMGVVFLLNALAIFIFPPLGHWLGLNQEQFGLFSALAIHDTSSVVATSSLYGDKAMELATTYKLTRALWIIPLSIFFSITEGRERDQAWIKKIKIPSFIFGFIACSALFSFMEPLVPLRSSFAMASKIGLSLTLGLIGLGMNIGELKRSGKQAITYGFSLWLITIVMALSLVKLF